MTAQLGNGGLSFLDRARALSVRARIGIILAVVIAVAVVAAFVPPIPQDPSYHNFADRRALWGIPNFGDVVSNVPFLLVGVLGIAFLLRRPDDASGHIGPLWWPFFVYFVGVALVALGSAYYHEAASNETLF
ncbi:MAG: ceramidase, partial [Alphaproteobacteria bacterium]|nr:ceramidase [Alphaproteobacteria bacterium]